MKMLKKSILAFSCIMLTGIVTNAQSFVKTHGSATDVAISPNDGSVYVVGTSKNVFKYNNSSRLFKPYGPQTKNINKIAIGKNNTVFATQAVTNYTQKYTGSGSNWKGLFYSYSSDNIATDKNGDVWASNIRSSRAIKKHNGNNWISATSKTQLGVTKIAPVDSQLAWVILKDKSIKKFENGIWKKMPGAALDIAIDVITKDVYVLGTSKRVFKWNKSSRKWLPLAGTRKDFVSLDVHNGKIWATATDKSIYYYDKNSSASRYKITFPKYTGNFNCLYFYGSMDVSVSVKGNTIKQNGEIYHRFINAPSNRPAKKSRIKTKNLEVPLYLGNGRIENRNQNSYSSYYNLNKSYIFDIEPGTRSSEIVFLIRSNIKLKCKDGNYFGTNRRMKVKVSDIALNTEYEIGTVGNIFGLRFKIEKL